MDNLFKIRTLTGSVNQMPAPERRIYNRLFQGKEHLAPSDRLAFDIITGSEKILATIKVVAPATITDKTSRKTITMTAPRLAHKRVIHTAELNAMRAYGSQIGLEQMKDRIAREQMDMKNMIDRTLEHWACGAMRGIIYDADLTTELVNYGLAVSHTPTLTSTDLWNDADSEPLTKIREYQKLIEDDSGTTITGWLAYVGSDVMDALLTHDSVLELLKYTSGVQIAREGRIGNLAGVEIVEYNGSFLDSTGTRRRMIEADHMLLIGLCSDLVDCPYAPIVDDDAPGGVGNVSDKGQGVLYFSKSWKVEDPSGRWIKVEARPLPVLQRPGAVVYAKVV
jgi:hypothetical protein